LHPSFTSVLCRLYLLAPSLLTKSSVGTGGALGIWSGLEFGLDWPFANRPNFGGTKRAMTSSIGVFEEESYHIYRSREGTRFEAVAYDDFKQQWEIPPLKAEAIPKSIIKKLFGKTDHVGEEEMQEVMDTNDMDVPQKSTRKGYDYVFFEVSESFTRLRLRSKYLVPVLGDAKINPNDDKQLLPTSNLFGKIRTNVDWGDVKPHFKIIFPVIDRDEHGHIETKRVDQWIEDLQSFNKKLVENTDYSMIQGVKVPFVFRPMHQVVVTPSTVRTIRPWIVDAHRETLNKLSQKGVDLVKVSATPGAGKTSFMAMLSENPPLPPRTRLIIQAFPRIDLANRQAHADCKVIHSDSVNVQKMVAESLAKAFSGKERVVVAVCFKGLQEVYDEVDNFTKRDSYMNVLIIIDEVHTFKDTKVMERMVNNPQIQLVLVTATVPRHWRFKKKILNETLSAADEVVGLSALQAVRLGYTLPPVFRLIKREYSQTDEAALAKYVCCESDARNVLVQCVDIDEVFRFLEVFQHYADCIFNTSHTTKTLKKMSKAYELTEEGKSMCVEYFTGLDGKKVWPEEKFLLNSKHSCGRMNVMLSIAKCLVGSDFPFVDHVVLNRPLHYDSETKDRHYDNDQQLHQYQRMTRNDPDHPKRMAEISMLDNEENRQAVARWFVEHDPNQEFAQVFFWDGTTTDDFLHQIVPNNDDFQKAFDVQKSAVRKVQSVANKNHEWDCLARAFLEKFGKRTSMFPTSFNEGDEVTLTMDDGHVVLHEASKVVSKLKENVLKHNIAPEVEALLRANATFMKYVDHPQLNNNSSMPETKPEKYDLWRTTKLPPEPFPFDEIKQFILKVRGIKPQTKAWFDQNLSFLCGHVSDCDYKYTLPGQKDVAENAKKTASMHLKSCIGLTQQSDLFVVKQEIKEKKLSEISSSKGSLSSCLSNVYYWQRYKMGLVTEEELDARIDEVAEKRRVHKSFRQNQMKGKRKRESI
jgi:hypothetical protein